MMLQWRTFISTNFVFFFIIRSNRNNCFEKYYLKKKKKRYWLCIQFFKNFLKINVTDIKILRKMILRNFNRDRRKLRNKMEFNFEQQNYFPCFFELKNKKKARFARKSARPRNCVRYEATLWNNLYVRSIWNETIAFEGRSRARWPFGVRVRYKRHVIFSRARFVANSTVSGPRLAGRSCLLHDLRIRGYDFSTPMWPPYRFFHAFPMSNC